MTALFVLLIAGSCQSLWAQGALIKVKMNNYQEKELFLAYYLGSKTYIADTATTKDKNGYFIFKRAEKYHPGMYMIVTKPDNNFFEFIMPDQQQFSIVATTGATTEWTVSGSAENQQFLEFSKALTKLRTRQNELHDLTPTKKPENQTPEEAAQRKKYVEEEKQLILQQKELTNRFIQQHAGSFFSNLLNALKEPEIPAALTDNNERFYYYRQHYFDKFPFGDNRLLYTTVLENKIDNYLEKLTQQQYDSVITAVDLIISKVKKAGDKEVYQNVVSQMLNKYAKSKTVCFDNVYVHIGQHYYCTPSAPAWIDKAQLEKICANVEALRFCGCGSVAPALNLVNAVNNQSINLFAVKADYTVLFFWMPDAKASDNEVTALKKWYADQKNKGIDVIGICAATTSKTKATVQSFAIPWATGSAAADELKWLETKYNIKSYPAIYVLDKEKKIIAKKIDVSTLAEVLKRLVK